MNYKQLKKRFSESELLISKKNVRFIEMLFKILKYDIDHDSYNKIIYGKKTTVTQQEKFIKSVYDAYMFLITNRKNDFSSTLIKKFYYLFKYKILDEDIALKLQSKYYAPSDFEPIEKIVDMHFYIYELFSFESDEVQILLAFIILNYLLYSYDLITIKITHKDYIEYEKVKDKYFTSNDRISAYELILKFLMTEKLQPKNYYLNLKPLALSDVYNEIKKDYHLINELYQINSVSVFGSFSKETERIDSDIDLIVSFKDDLSYKEKIGRKSEFENYLFHKFSRYIDVHEFNKYVFEQMINEIRNIKKIF